MCQVNSINRNWNHKQMYLSISTSWRQKWQHTPVFLPGEFYGQRSLVDFSPWGHKESDTTAHSTFPLVSGTNRCSNIFNISNWLINAANILRSRSVTFWQNVSNFHLIANKTSLGSPRADIVLFLIFFFLICNTCRQQMNSPGKNSWERENRNHQCR